MHVVTFIFVCLEVLILAHLVLYRLIRPDIKETHFSIALLALLIVYNVTGGLLPDEQLPGSHYFQLCVAYGTGFITPCYFPFYVFKVFDLKKMKFHAYVGVFLFLLLPYLIFVTILGVTKELEDAKRLLIIPILYALWVLYSLHRAIRFKYGQSFESRASKEEIIILFLSLASWVGVPVIDYFNLGQAGEAFITNMGFLLLFSLQVKRHILHLRKEHERLLVTEERLSGWNKAHESKEKKVTSLASTDHAENTFELNAKAFQLTKREKEIVQYIAMGYTYKSIAALLYISERTVNKHVQNIFEKVDVSNKMELIKKLQGL
jgi:DNA-binding CsgD family transcriptional regulator